MLRESFEDVVIEPQRAALIPGFAEVRRAALAAGALGCSISGAGPTVFAWCLRARTPQAVLRGHGAGVLAPRTGARITGSRDVPPRGARVID